MQTTERAKEFLQHPLQKSTSHVVLAAAGERVGVIDIGWVLTPGRLSSKDRLIDPELPTVDQNSITENLINDLTDAVSLYSVEYDRNAREELFGVMPSVCYAADVEKRIKTAGQVEGYEAVAIPKARLADGQCQTETKQHGVRFQDAYDVLPGVRLRDDRIVTVSDGELTECPHPETESIDGEHRRRCTDCGRSFDPQAK